MDSNMGGPFGPPTADRIPSGTIKPSQSHVSSESIKSSYPRVFSDTINSYSSTPLGGQTPAGRLGRNQTFTSSRSSGRSLPQTNVVRGRETSSDSSSLSRTYTSTGLTNQLVAETGRSTNLAVVPQHSDDVGIYSDRPDREEAYIFEDPSQEANVPGRVDSREADSRLSEMMTAAVQNSSPQDQFTYTDYFRGIATTNLGAALGLALEHIGFLNKMLNEQQKNFACIQATNHELKEKVKMLERESHAQSRTRDGDSQSDGRGRNAQTSRIMDNDDLLIFDSNPDQEVIPNQFNCASPQLSLANPNAERFIPDRTIRTLRPVHTSRDLDRGNDENREELFAATNTHHSQYDHRVGDTLGQPYTNRDTAIDVERPRIATATGTDPRHEHNLDLSEHNRVRPYHSSHGQINSSRTLDSFNTRNSGAMTSQPRATHTAAAVISSKKRGSEDVTTGSSKKTRRGAIDFPHGAYNIEFSKVWEDGNLSPPGDVLRPALRKQFSHWYTRDLAPYKDGDKLSKRVCLERKRKHKGMNNTTTNSACQDCEKEGLLCIRIVNSGVLSIMPLQEGSRQGQKTSLGYWTKTGESREIEETEDSESERTDPEE